jgi:hypothetical protein
MVVDLGKRLIEPGQLWLDQFPSKALLAIGLDDNDMKTFVKIDFTLSIVIPTQLWQHLYDKTATLKFKR